MTLQIDKKDIKLAYCFLKNHAYQENINLFLKERVARFECDETAFESMESAISSVLNSSDLCQNTFFNKWLDQIDFFILPKGIKNPKLQPNEINEPLFLSNVKTADKYYVDKLNYWINAPIELHIIETLWTLLVGSILDSSMRRDCYGYRLSEQTKQFYKQISTENQSSTNSSNNIFIHYHEQYSRWRDKAIDMASNLAKEENNVAMFTLDLKSFFYHIKINFKDLNIIIKEQPDSKDRNDEYELCLKLNDLLEIIYKRYQTVTADCLKITHPDVKENCGIPIGFTSSAVLANWYMTKFDKDIGEKMSPAYYGRYVDDLIFVLKNPTVDDTDKNPVDEFIKSYFNGFICPDERDNSNYCLENKHYDLPVQKDKLILHFFDKEHSTAGLKVFKKELEERSSAFRFLPDEHVSQELDKYAYDLMYNGSANKFRSIVGLVENETEFSKYLLFQITANRLCDISKKETVIEQIKLFFRGENTLRFSSLWEKVFSYALILKNYDFAFEFYKQLLKVIDEKTFWHEDKHEDKKVVTEKLISGLKSYLQISFCIPASLLDTKLFNPSESKPKSLGKLVELFQEKEITEICTAIRQANLMRHRYVSWPLINYTDYKGDLTDKSAYLHVGDNKINKTKQELTPRFIHFKIDKTKQELTPRFIHFDEWQLFNFIDVIANKKPLIDIDSKNEQPSSFLENLLDSYNKEIFSDEFPVKIYNESAEKTFVKVIKLEVGEEPKNRTKLRVAIANVKIEEKRDIEASFLENKKPNISFERQKQLYYLLNVAEREKVELMVLPEVSIPVSWLPFMVSHARRRQIALIFGLEYWISNNIAYNFIVEILPFKIKKKYKSCLVTLRVKNHYAPAERDMLEAVRLKLGEPDEQYYHLVKWSGITFSTYNCFELSNIQHRSIFRSKLDLLIACVWNKDTRYYDHILESAVRDVHCYVIQANTSQYGGSCVLQPTSSEKNKLIYVKGGDNSCILTTQIDIEKLREFQYKSRTSKEDGFKPIPPGFDNEEVLER